MVGVRCLAIIFTLIVLTFVTTVQCQNKPDRRCRGRFETYESCGTACPKTCKDILKPNPNKACTYQCISGCFCRDGYVRASTRSSPCVSAKSCR